MISPDKILAKMSNEIGFRGEDLSLDNQESKSGLMFQDVSPLIDLSYIRETHNETLISSDDFDDLLTSMRQQAVMQVVNKVFQGNQDFVLSTNLYPFEKSFTNLVPRYDKFVGFRIDSTLNGYACRISWVELSFDTDTEITLYLYNSNKPKTPLKQQTIEVIAGESVAFDLDWFIGDTATVKGGQYYFGYFDNSIGEANAYKKDHNVSNLAMRSNYYSVSPIALDHEGAEINVRGAVFHSETSGLNLGITVYNDYTELILNNKQLFWQAIQYQMHEIVLSQIKYSNRSNILQRIAADAVKYVDFELYGNPDSKIDGVQTKLNREIENIRKSLFYVPRIRKVTLR
jgi:hypothetical protein